MRCNIRQRGYLCCRNNTNRNNCHENIYDCYNNRTENQYDWNGSSRIFDIICNLCNRAGTGQRRSQNTDRSCQRAKCDTRTHDLAKCDIVCINIWNTKDDIKSNRNQKQNNHNISGIDNCFVTKPCDYTEYDQQHNGCNCTIDRKPRKQRLNT